MATELITDIINENNNIIRPKTVAAAITDWDTAFEAKTASLHLISTASLNSTLANYVTTNNLAQTNSLVTQINSQVTNLNNTVNTIASNYINNDNLSNAINALGIPTAGTLDNYYTKAEVDTGFLSAATGSNYYTKTQADNRFVSNTTLTDTLSAYAITADLENTYALYDSVYTKSEVYTIAQTYSRADLYTRSELYTKSNLYTQSQIDTKLDNINNKFDGFYPKAQVYTKAEVDNQLAQIAAGGEIDLSGYVTTTSLETILSDYPTNTDLNNYNFLTRASLPSISISSLDNSGENPFITRNDIAPVGFSGVYDDLELTPISRFYLTSVPANYAQANTLVFNGEEINSTNYPNNWFLLLCQTQINTNIVSTAWIVAPGLRFIQRLNIFDNSPTVYPQPDFTTSGVLYVKMTGAGSNVYDINNFIVQTK